MNARTTLDAYIKDFKNILINWRQFQPCKLQVKMDNTFPCRFNNSQGIVNILTTLSFITEGRYRMEFGKTMGVPTSPSRSSSESD